jgi:hypothetical protein
VVLVWGRMCGMRTALLLAETDDILTFRTIQGNVKYGKRKSRGCHPYLKDRRVIL